MPRYYHPDALGSVHHLTDAAGQVTDNYEFDAFGNQWYASGASPNPHRFVGQLGYHLEPDATAHGLELMKLGARYYDPSIGRFITQDPIGYGGGLNQYAYVDSNPVGWADPLGLAKKKPEEEDKRPWYVKLWEGGKRLLFGEADPILPEPQYTADGEPLNNADAIKALKAGFNDEAFAEHCQEYGKFGTPGAPIPFVLREAGKEVALFLLFNGAGRAGGKVVSGVAGATRKGAKAKQACQGILAFKGRGAVKLPGKRSISLDECEYLAHRFDPRVPKPGHHSLRIRWRHRSTGEEFWTHHLLDDGLQPYTGAKDPHPHYWKP